MFYNASMQLFSEVSSRKKSAQKLPSWNGLPDRKESFEGFFLPQSWWIRTWIRVFEHRRTVSEAAKQEGRRRKPAGRKPLRNSRFFGARHAITPGRSQDGQPLHTAAFALQVSAPAARGSAL